MPAFVEMVMYPAKSLEVELAGRYEKTSYENAGSFGKFNPKLGIAVDAGQRPVHSRVGRYFVPGSGTGLDVCPGQRRHIAQQIGGDTINARGLLVGNPNLKPETSRNWNLGVTWDVTADFTAELNYFNIKFKNLIAAENAQQILTADEADGFITDPAHIVLNPGAPNQVCEITGRWKPGQGPRPPQLHVRHSTSWSSSRPT